MKSDKTFAQVRGDILSDIEAVRMGRMPPTTAAVIFAGYKVATDSINTEINAAKFALHAKDVGYDFGKTAKLGRLVINGEEDDTPRIAP